MKKEGATQKGEGASRGVVMELTEVTCRGRREEENEGERRMEEECKREEEDKREEDKREEERGGREGRKTRMRRWKA